MNFDSIYSSVKDFAVRAADKLTHSADVATLQVKLAMAEKRLDEAYRVLGKLAYRNFAGKEDSADKIQSAMSAIDAIKSEMKALKAQIEQKKKEAAEAERKAKEEAAQKKAQAQAQAQAQEQDDDADEEENVAEFDALDSSYGCDDGACSITVEDEATGKTE